MLHYPVVVGTVRVARPRELYQARPGRAALVATDLADLKGPATGTVELPLRLFWSHRDRTFDLDSPAMLQWMYETVLREAIHADELIGFLNGDTLVAIWPDLLLPKGVRRAWEDCHPVLRGAPPTAG
jgi:hypothetical protein